MIRVDHRKETSSKNEFEIALVDDVELSVAYYDKVTLLPEPKVSGGQLAYNLVWRSASSRYSEALNDSSLQLLFDYTIQDYDIFLVADKMIDGGIFDWYRQVSKAIDKGLHAYVYDQITKALEPIPTQRALSEFQDQAWSGAHQNSLRAIISSTALASCQDNMK